MPGSVLQLIEDERKVLLRAVQLHRNCSTGSGMSRHTRKVKQSLTAMEIARRQRELARETLEIYCAHLAQCLSTVVNLLDPDVIVLGGGLSISHCCMRQSLRRCQIMYLLTL